MKIAHIGPPRARLGGPAGYLAELARAASEEALAELAREGIEVELPPAAPPRPAPSPPPRLPALRRRLGRWLRPWLRPLRGRPRFFRHSEAELTRAGGPLEAHFTAARDGVLEETRPSLANALAGADVLFCHDPFSAGEALAGRRDAQQVWLLIHAPMPLALYLAWSWGVPEWPWERFLTLPDVGAWIDRELAVVGGCDRVLLPCPEAAEELVRIDGRFAPPLAGADYLLTGAGGTGGTAPSPLREETRRRLGLPAGEPVGLYLGNAQPYRGLDALCAALPELPSPEELPGCIAVAGPPAPSLPRHRRLRALGRVSDVSALLAAVDFVVNVNRFSLFDLSTIEAVEAGRPLLLHAVGGNKTFASLGAGCRMLADLSPPVVAEGLTGMFHLPEGELRRLGAASRRCWQEHLTPEHLWRRHRELYRRVAGLQPTGEG